MDFGMPMLLELPDLPACAALCSELGLQFMELNMNFPWCSLEALNANMLNALSKEYGIYFTLHFEEQISPCDLNPLVAKAYTDTALAAISLANELNMPAITMHLNRGIFITLPGKKVFLYEVCKEQYLKNWTAFRDSCTGRLAHGAARLCIENTNGWDRPYLQDTVALLLESPLFALTLDTGHSCCQGGSDEARMRKTPDRLYHMHLHDAVGDACHLPLGAGSLNIPAYLTLAKSQGCRTVLEIKTIEALRASVSYLKERALL